MDKLPAPMPILLPQITRRKFVSAAGGALLSLGFLGLEGCGGGGIGGSSPALKMAAGSVALPQGISKSLGSLVIANGVNQVKVGANSSFSAKTAGANASLAFVADSQNRCLLLGFLTPGTNNVLDVHSTAAALVYFGLGGYAADPTNAGAIVALITKHSATAQLAATISTRMVANAYAVDQNDSMILAALATAVNAIAGTSPTARPILVAPFASNADQITLTGDNPRSGISIDLSTKLSGITATNSYRRYGSLYIYETGTVDSAGNTDNLTKSKLISTTDIQSTQRLNVFTALGDIFTSSAPFSPVTSPDLPLALETNTKQTLYDIIVLGSSMSPIDPAFYGFAQYADEVAGWKTKRSALNLRSALGDIFFGLVLNFLGVTTLNAVPVVTLDEAIAYLKNVQQAAMRTAIEDVVNDLAFDGPIRAAYTVIKGGGFTPEDMTQVFSAFDHIMKLANPAAAAAVSVERFNVLFTMAFRAIFGAVTGASLALGLVDLAGVLKDATSSTKGDLWSATVNLPTVKISPTSATINPASSDPVEFTASLPPGITGNFVYTWTVTGGQTAQLDDLAGHEAATLTKIKAASVYLYTTSADTSNLVVTVEAFAVDSSGAATLIGHASAAVTVSTTLVSGSEVCKMTINECAPNADGSLWMIAFAAFTEVTGAATYHYTKDGGLSGPIVTAKEIAAGGYVSVVGLSYDNLSKAVIPGGSNQCYYLGNNTIGMGVIAGEYGDAVGITADQMRAQITAVYNEDTYGVEYS